MLNPPRASKGPIVRPSFLPHWRAGGSGRWWDRRSDIRSRDRPTSPRRSLPPSAPAPEPLEGAFQSPNAFGGRPGRTCAHHPRQPWPNIGLSRPVENFRSDRPTTRPDTRPHAKMTTISSIRIVANTAAYGQIPPSPKRQPLVTERSASAASLPVRRRVHRSDGSFLGGRLCGKLGKICVDLCQQLIR